jgi:hypothetical protein
VRAVCQRASPQVAAIRAIATEGACGAVIHPATSAASSSAACPGLGRSPRSSSQITEPNPLGGRIMAEVLVGLLQRDPNSYLYLDPAWKPAPPLAPTSGTFTFVDLLPHAGAT